MVLKYFHLKCFIHLHPDDRINDVVSNKKWAKCFFVTSQLSSLSLWHRMEISIVTNLILSIRESILSKFIFSIVIISVILSNSVSVYTCYSLSLLALVYFSGPWENVLILWQYLIFYCFKLHTSLT